MDIRGPKFAAIGCVVSLVLIALVLAALIIPDHMALTAGVDRDLAELRAAHPQSVVEDTREIESEVDSVHYEIRYRITPEEPLKSERWHYIKGDDGWQKVVRSTSQ